MLHSMLLVSNLAPGGPTSNSLAPSCPITLVWKYRVILKTLNSWFRFVLNRIDLLSRTISLPGAGLDTAFQVKPPKNTDNIKGSHFDTKQRVCVEHNGTRINCKVCRKSACYIVNLQTMPLSLWSNCDVSQKMVTHL